MKSVVIRGKERMSIENTPKPDIVHGEVLVSPKYVGICGSDLHYYYNGAVGQSVIREPLIPGHEVSGVLETQTSVDGKKIPVGTHVTIHPATWGTPVPGLEKKREIWPDGKYLGSAATLPHTQGAMTELLAVRVDQIRVLPDELPLRRAALAEPLGVALHGLKLAGNVEGRRLFISGAGPIGLLVVAASAIMGAKEVVAADMLPGPLERARTVGATSTYQIGSGEKLDASSFDVVLECSGSPAAVSQAFRVVRAGGVIVQIGMLQDKASPINLSSINTKEAMLLGSYRFDKEFDLAIRLLTNNPIIEKVITHEYSINKVMQAFEMAHDSQTSGKVLITLGQDNSDLQLIYK